MNSSTSLKINRPDSLKKFSKKSLYEIEEVYLKLLKQYHNQALVSYRKSSKVGFWVFASVSWLIIPLFVWPFYKKRYLEVEILQKIEFKIKNYEHKKRFWYFFSKTKTPKSINYSEMIEFYEMLLKAIKGYNTRIELYDYTLNRQNQKLDKALTVGELEAINTTFERIYNEILSAIKLHQLALANPSLDFADLIKNESTLDQNLSYLTSSSEMAQKGEFIGELLVIESELKKDLANFFK